MAERKLTPREKQLKREDPERFALLMANRTKRKGSMKTGLTKFSKDKTFKPTKKKKKVKRNQRIGGGTLFSKLSKDSVTDSAEKREDKVRPKRAKPVVAIKPSVLKDSKKRGSMKPGLDKVKKIAKEREAKMAKPIVAIKPSVSKKRGSMKPGLDKVKKIAKEREDKVNRNLTLGKKVIPTPIPKAMTMKKKPVSPKKKRSPIAKSDTRYLNDYRIEKTTADDNYDPRAKKRSPIAKSDTRYLNDYRIEKTAADDNYDPRESLFGAMFSGNQTPEDKVVRNPFTGNDMMLSYDFPEDTEDMKKGGSIKKKMKKGKVRKRAALRGQGKALRGF
jgi:hypothetical protein